MVKKIFSDNLETEMSDYKNWKFQQSIRVLKNEITDDNREEIEKKIKELREKKVLEEL